MSAAVTVIRSQSWRVRRRGAGERDLWPRKHTTMEQVEGRCYCGEVEFKIRSMGPAKSIYCHCKNCRLAHAAPLYLVQYFTEAEFEVAKGSSLVKEARLRRPSRTFKRYFCSECGTRIYNWLKIEEERNEFSVGTYAGAFPALYDNGVPSGYQWQPTAHCCTSEAIIPLHMLSDGLDRFEAFS